MGLHSLSLIHTLRPDLIVRIQTTANFSKTASLDILEQIFAIMKKALGMERMSTEEVLVIVACRVYPPTQQD
jgi:hypothetical protein